MCVVRAKGCVVGMSQNEPTRYNKRWGRCGGEGGRANARRAGNQTNWVGSPIQVGDHAVPRILIHGYGVGREGMSHPTKNQAKGRVTR